MKKQIIIGSISAFISGIIFHVIIPAVLQFVVSVLLSAATILDPLHAKGRLDSFWTAFVTILILQIIYTISIAFSVGISISLLVEKIKSGWVYLASAFLSLVIHYILILIIAGGSLIFVEKDIVIGFLVLFLILITFTAPIIGLICTAFIRRQKFKQK